MTRMLVLLNRDILTLLNLIGVDDEMYGRFNSTRKRTIQAVIDMYHQQEEMLRLGTHTCENRIISIHQPHLRPIVRGKAKAKVEFGTGKRAYRANNIRAKLPDTARCRTGMCYFVKNLTKFLAELCRVLTEACLCHPDIGRFLIIQQTLNNVTSYGP